MQYLLFFLAASVALTVFKSAMGIVIVMLIGALLLSAIWRPAQSFGVLLFCCWIYLLGQHGWATLLGTAVLMLCGYLAKRIGW